MWPLPLKYRAIGTIDASLAPRLTTMLILTGAEPARRPRRRLPSSTFATGKSTSFIARKCRVVERIEADGDASEAGIAQAAGFPREQRTVGGQREVDVAESREHFDQALDVAAKQRLAAGQPELASRPGRRRSGRARVISSNVSSSARGRNSW